MSGQINVTEFPHTILMEVYIAEKKVMYVGVVNTDLSVEVRISHFVLDCYMSV